MPVCVACATTCVYVVFEHKTHEVLQAGCMHCEVWAGGRITYKPKRGCRNWATPCFIWTLNPAFATKYVITIEQQLKHDVTNMVQ